MPASRRAAARRAFHAPRETASRPVPASAWPPHHSPRTLQRLSLLASQSTTRPAWSRPAGRSPRRLFRPPTKQPRPARRRPPPQRVIGLDTSTGRAVYRASPTTSPGLSGLAADRPECVCAGGASGGREAKASRAKPGPPPASQRRREVREAHAAPQRAHHDWPAARRSAQAPVHRPLHIRPQPAARAPLRLHGPHPTAARGLRHRLVRVALAASGGGERSGCVGKGVVDDAGDVVRMSPRQAALQHKAGRSVEPPRLLQAPPPHRRLPRCLVPALAAAASRPVIVDAPPSLTGTLSLVSPLMRARRRVTGVRRGSGHAPAS